ncbi:hypothetical protein OD91_0531 [Lutibacter sp. Hel_I_33_5]|uniref:hypothetical protein n=1 Tax=Lutibacter sp. Hel_I_33_5 TaxID=1566289 RepID=UPI00119F243D|nr:hypothetical protein [Lutibacter sp. Hel_I_33_5]TVZ55285.1 hypothetical protein OD91_0531 [Lutibacter sp. Hel_I_33_5]
MKKLSLLLFALLIFSSCATILNKKTSVVKISADKESKIIFQKDTILINKKQIKIRPIRSKKNLKVTVLKDSLKRDFYFENKISPLFWMNITSIYSIGMLVDLFSDKRFTYKHNLHFITDRLSKKIELSSKKIALIPKNKLFIYTSPIKLVDFTSIPMTTLGVEYFVKNNFSISAEYGTFLRTKKLRRHNVTYLRENAYTYRLETKVYNIINLTQNVHSNEYIGLEFRKIVSQYNDYLDYSERTDKYQYNYTRDDFATYKNVTVVNFKYGMIVPIGNRLYFDFYGGLGIRTKRFDHINLEYDKSLHSLFDLDDFPTFDLNYFRDYNKRSLLNISLGFKFGFKL